MNTAQFWTDATALTRNVATRTRLNPRYIGGDVGEVKADMIQEGLMAAAGWLSQHDEFAEQASLEICRSRIYEVIKTAMFDYLKQVNRENGHELSASEWLENMGEADKTTVEIEQEPEEAAQNTLEEIIENNENSALKESITCLSKEMQAIVLLHNDGFSTSQIGKRLNRHRERARQLYHEAMRELKGRISKPVKSAELPLSYAGAEAETMLFSSVEERLGELRYRQRSTGGNISNLTRLMRRGGKNGQLPLF
jgi:RNA polymerase sigma factor (sigma-70 family)